MGDKAFAQGGFLLGRDVFLGRITAQGGQDRAIGTIVAMEILGKMLQRADHFLQFSHLLLQLLQMPFGDALDVAARPFAVSSKGQKILNMLDGKAKVAGPADKAKGLDVLVLIDPIARVGA